MDVLQKSGFVCGAHLPCSDLHRFLTCTVIWPCDTEGGGMGGGACNLIAPLSSCTSSVGLEKEKKRNPYYGLKPAYACSNAIAFSVATKFTVVTVIRGNGHPR